MRLASTWTLIAASAVAAAWACGSADERVAPRAGAGEAGAAAGGAAAAGGDGPRPGAAGSPDGSGGSTLADAGASPLGGASGSAGAGGELAAGGNGEAAAGGVIAAGGALTEGGAAGAATAPETVVVDLDFDDAIPAELDPGTSVLVPSQGYAPLGPSGNQFGETFLRGPTGNSITLTIDDLPPHSTLSLSLLFAAIDSLDGTGTFPAGDFFKITLDEVVIFRESFANALPEQVQSYDPPEGVILARRVDLGFQGPGGFYTDSAYDFGQDPRFDAIPHTGDSAVLVFTLEGEGVQSVDDESWAIDNVRVRVK